MTITHMHGDDPESLTGTVARRVRGLLAESAMRQQELGPILGISGSAVSKRLRAQMPFGLEELPQLAEAFDVTLPYLLGLTDDRSPRRSAPGGGSMFVMPERTTGLSAALRACRDSNPKPSDLVLWVRRFVALLGHLVFADRTPVQTSDLDGGEESGAVIIGFPVHRAAAARIQAGEWPDDPGPEPEPTSARPTLLKVVS